MAACEGQGSKGRALSGSSQVLVSLDREVRAGFEGGWVGASDVLVYAGCAWAGESVVVAAVWAGVVVPLVV